MADMTPAEALARACIEDGGCVDPNQARIARLRALGFEIVPVEAGANRAERGARAACAADGHGPDDDWSEWKPNMPDRSPEPAWWTYLDGAKKSYAAMVAPDAEKGKL